MYFWAIASTWTFRSRANALLGQHAVLVALGFDEPLEVVERELGVDRDETVDLDHGVHSLAVAEPVLELVSAGRKTVAKQVREQELAEAAARLRWPERLLEPLEVVRAGEDLLVRAPELPELVMDLARRLRGALEAPVERRGHRLEPPVDRRAPRVELRPGVRPQGAELGAQVAHEPDSAGGEPGEGEQDEDHDPHRTAER